MRARENSMEKDDMIGRWSLEKLDLLKKYLLAYVTVLKKQVSIKGYEYIDGFAGQEDPKPATNSAMSKVLRGWR